jgi:preprotein translocase subunit SecE
VAQPKTSQQTSGRFAANREQARRGGTATPAPARPSAPLTAAAGGRGRRGTLSFVGFIRDVRSELRKVVWPTRRETVNLTAVVLALSAVVGAFLGAVDFVFQEFFRLLLGLAGSGGL